MPLHQLDHPLACHWLTALRDAATAPEEFRRLCSKISLLLLLEATRDLPLRRKGVRTPLMETEGAELACGVTVVPILRAGLGMVPVAVDLLPGVSVGYVGMERDESTAEARPYYSKGPPLAGRRVLVLDPMLATGGSAAQTLRALIDRGASDLRLLSIVAAPEGVSSLQAAFPQLPIYLAALDDRLDARKFILPGLGDFGDRLWGT